MSVPFEEILAKQSGQICLRVNHDDGEREFNIAFHGDYLAKVQKDRKLSGGQLAAEVVAHVARVFARAMANDGNEVGPLSREILTAALLGSAQPRRKR